MVIGLAVTMAGTLHPWALGLGAADLWWVAEVATAVNGTVARVPGAGHETKEVVDTRLLVVASAGVPAPHESRCHDAVVLAGGLDPAAAGATDVGEDEGHRHAAGPARHGSDLVDNVGDVVSLELLVNDRGWSRAPHCGSGGAGAGRDVIHAGGEGCGGEVRLALDLDGDRLVLDCVVHLVDVEEKPRVGDGSVRVEGNRREADANNLLRAVVHQLEIGRV